MKRALLTLLLLLVATSTFALDTTKRGNRIGVLVTRDRYAQGPESAMAAAIGKYLRDELQKAGFEAVLTNITYDELNRNAAEAYDYYVEVASSETSGGAPAGIGVGTASVAVDLSVVVTHVAAEVRLYDGRSLELIRRFDLKQSKKGIAPTSIAIGGGGLFGWISIPISEIVQFRRAAHAVAKDAATQVADYRSAE
jgi:hypothetical protein